MSKILIFPWPEFGHLLPTLALARELTTKGHQVIYLTAPQFNRYVTAVGALIEPLCPQNASEIPLSGSSLWYRHILDYGRDSHAIKFNNLVTTLVRNEKFSLVLCDHRLGRMCHRTVVTEAGNDHVISFSTSLFDWGGPYEWSDPTIVFCPEEFELDKFRKQRCGVHYVESSLPPLEIDADEPGLVIGDGPMIVVAFGTQSARYRHIIELLLLVKELARRHSDLQFVVATGRHSHPELLRDIAELPNLTVRQRIPQRSLLQRASVMITHGGCGSIKEAIYAGVPMIVLPMLYDQPFNAMRVRHQGLGEAFFPGKYTLLALEAAVCDAVGGRYSSRLKRMQSQFIASENERRSSMFVTNWLAEAPKSGPRINDFTDSRNAKSRVYENCSHLAIN